MRNPGFNKKGLCKLCKKPPTEKGHDPCIANLPGVLYACCGHGHEEGYIKFTDGRCLTFDPIKMDLDFPKHYWVHNPIPIRISGDRNPSLNFKTRKKTNKKLYNSTPVEMDGWKLIENGNRSKEN